MTVGDTASLLSMFQHYWPNFSIQERDGNIPGTVDAWHELLVTERPKDCAEALKRIVSEAGRKFAPSASEFLTTLRDVRIARLQSEELAAAKQRRISGPIEPLATPEQAQVYFGKINEILANMPTMAKKKDEAPIVLDERHDWAGTYKHLRHARKLAQVDTRIPQKQTDGSWL